MKRPHRGMHLLTWLILGPAILAVGIVAWLQRPETPYADIPDIIEADKSSLD